MPAPWLVLDCDNLLRRAWYAMKQVGEDRADGMLFGFFKDILQLRRQFMTSRVAFCFDSRDSLRKQLLPGYKANRLVKLAKMNREERAEETSRHGAVLRLRKEYLPQLGFTNIFHSKGYEADDLIAMAVRGGEERYMVVSSDKDLYQLLRPNRVRIWCPSHGKKIPGKLVTAKSFQELYGIRPTRWAAVKCIAGCAGDCVPGVDGVAEKRAIMYLRGELKVTSEWYMNIRNATDLIIGNEALVKLPFKDCPPVPLVPDQPDPRAWVKLMKQLDMEVLI